MNLRQEQIVFLIAALILGVMVYGDVSGDTSGQRTRTRRAGGAQAV